MSKWVYFDELQLAEINVPRAALHFARLLEYPTLDVAGYMAKLHEISEEASEFVEQNQPILTQTIELSRYLFKELGFKGNSADYTNPRNSFLNEVIDCRMGIPISLSVVFIDIATRLGLPAYGISLPGHFIVGVRDRDADYLFDPFHGGRQLDLTDCAQLIQQSAGYEGPLDASWFAPTPARSILARMLGNLRANYVSTSSWNKASQVIQLLRQTQPDNAEHLRDLGLVYYRQRHIPQAAHYLNAYLQKLPDAADSDVIRNGMKHLLDKWVPMN